MEDMEEKKIEPTTPETPGEGAAPPAPKKRRRRRKKPARPAESAAAVRQEQPADQGEAAEPTTEPPAPAPEAEPPGREEPPAQEPEGKAPAPDEAAEQKAPEPDKPAEPPEAPAETEEQRRRTAEMTRTVQLSIEKLMAALPAEPAPETDEEAAAPTMGQRVLSGMWGLCKWLLLVLAFVAVVAGVGIGWLYSGATEDMLPEVAASFAGQTLETAAYDWRVPVVGDWFKRSYAKQLTREPQQLDEVQTASVSLSIQADQCESRLVVEDAEGETVFDGAGEEFVTFEFTENGDYTAELTVYRTETGLSHEAGVSGSQTYRFAFTVNLRPSFRLNTTAVQQGGVAVVRVSGVSETPVLTTELTATPFYEGQSGWIAYLPIEVDRPTGKYTIQLQAGAFTQEYTLTVRQTSASARDYSWRSELTTPYLSAEETPAEVQALLTVADPEMAWAEGGFVQPFPSTIEVTLPFGTTEYVGRTVSQRQAGTGTGRTATNAVISSERGGALIAPANGRVLLAEDLGGTAGNTLVIEHGGGVKSIFYNLRTLQVDAGDTVGIGEQIATTNAVTIGEVRIGEVPVDPLPIWRGLCDAMRYY